MSLILMLMFVLSTMLIFSNHPMMMNMIIILQSINTAIMTNLISYTPWFSYILFMIMIGGMMVMFIYMTSMIPNTKFPHKKKMLSLIPLNTVIWMWIKPMEKSNKLVIMNLNIKNMDDNWSYELSLNKFMNFPLSMTMIALLIFLFITMMATIKISSKKAGPLRKK